MIASVRSAVLFGLECRPVDVQVDIASGATPKLVLVGLPSGSVREALERVRSALRNSGGRIPPRRVLINLAPAELRKEGGGLDLAIAAAIVLADSGRPSLPGAAFVGELGLDGSVCHVDGVLVLARGLARRGVRRLYVPAADAAEAGLVEGLEVVPCRTLAEVVEELTGASELPIHERKDGPWPPAPPVEDDLAEVHGQGEARRALEIAAAGGHHLLMSGPPGSGKTMLARCLPGILPPLSRAEALELAQVASVLGELRTGRPLAAARPFRSPHHTVSMAGLVGGGSTLARPGEVSRAQASVTVSPMRAAIYTRISHDPEWTRLGVRRQEQDCRQLVERHGWEVAGVYEDDDVSAYSGRARPAYQRLLADLEGGVVQAVIAWHPDRLHRHPRELEKFIDVIEQTGAVVETVRAGRYDLSTPSGRAMARTLGAWARYESEHKADRLKRKHQELAEHGQDAGGGRPFGYEADRKTIRPEEAALVREAAKRVLGGESMRSVCLDWTKRGVATVTGAQWSVQVMRRMLASARISGRREYRRKAGRTADMGEIVNEHAAWPAIITVEQSDALRSLFANGDRRTNGNPTRYLLAGIAVCGLCGAPLVARPRVTSRSMVCAKGPGFKGCGGIRVQADPLEGLITDAVLEAVDAGRLAALLERTDDREAVMKLAEVQAQLELLATDYYVERRINRGEWERAQRGLKDQERQLQARLAASRRVHQLDGLPDPLRAAWPEMPLHRRRVVVKALLESVVIAPAVRGRNTFDTRRVDVVWRAPDDRVEVSAALG